MLRLSVKFAIDTLEKETLHTFLDVRCTGTQQSPLFSSRVCLPPRARDEKLSDFNHPLRSSKFRAKSASIDYEYSARCRTGVERAFRGGKVRRSSHDWKFRSRAPRFDLHTRVSRSIMTSRLARVSRARTRQSAGWSGVRAVTVNKSRARPCAPHRRGEIDRELRLPLRRSRSTSL